MSPRRRQGAPLLHLVVGQASATPSRIGWSPFNLVLEFLESWWGVKGHR